MFNTMKKSMAICLSVLIFLQSFSAAASAADLDLTADYQGTVLAAINTDYHNLPQTFSAYCAEEPTAAGAQTDTHFGHAAGAEENLLCGADEAVPQPLSPIQALQKEASLGHDEAQAAAEYRVGDKKTVHSSYRSEYKSANVTLFCTNVGTNCTVWVQDGMGYNAEQLELFCSRFDALIERELALFGDKRIDTDRDGKIALFIHDLDSGYGGYFSSADLADRLGRIGNVWFQQFGNGNACDCVHLSWASLSTAVHEYQHYIQCSWQYVGKNNFTYIGNSHESYINEGFSRCAEYLLMGYDDVWWFNAAVEEPDRCSLVNWSFDSRAYALGFVFCQYLRTRYAQLVGEESSTEIYKTILEIRSGKKVPNTLSVAAELLYPASQYPDLKTDDSRCRQLLTDFWLAVLCKEKDGLYGFNGENWANPIKATIQGSLPVDGSKGIRSGMAAFYYVYTPFPDGIERGTACVTEAGDDLVFVGVDNVGYRVVYDWNNDTWVSETFLRFTDTEYVQEEYDVFFPGKAFLGWSTDPSAITPRYTGGEAVKLSPDRETVLYAVWEDAQTMPLGQDVTLKKSKRDYCLRFVPEQSGYYILSADAGVSTNIVLDRKIIEPNRTDWFDTDPFDESSGYQEMCYYLYADTPYDIYAQRWLRNDTVRIDFYPQQYTLRYDANLEMTQPRQQNGKAAYVLSDIDEDSRVLARSKGLAFTGWALQPDAETAQMQPNDVFTLEADTTLYAVWKPIDALYADNSVVLSYRTFETKMFTVTPEKDGTYRFLAYVREAEADDDVALEFRVYDTDGKCLYTSPSLLQMSDLTLRAGKTYIIETTCFSYDEETYTVDFFFGTVSSDASARLLLDAKNCYVKGDYLALQNRFVYTIPKLTPAADDGSTFVGWSEYPNDEETPVYRAGDRIDPVTDMVLYPVWKQPHTTNRWLPTLRALLQKLRVLVQAAVLLARHEIVLSDLKEAP